MDMLHATGEHEHELNNLTRLCYWLGNPFLKQLKLREAGRVTCALTLSLGLENESAARDDSDSFILSEKKT